MSQTIYLASGNAHKLHELQTALDSAGLTVQVLGPDKIGGLPDVEETGSTFEANSLLKAHGLQEVGPADAAYAISSAGNYIFDYSFDEIPLRDLHEKILTTPGVIETGIFYAITDCALIVDNGHIEVISK